MNRNVEVEDLFGAYPKKGPIKGLEAEMIENDGETIKLRLVDAENVGFFIVVRLRVREVLEGGSDGGTHHEKEV